MSRSAAATAVPPGLFGIRRRSKTRLVIALIFAAVSVLPLLYMVSLSFQPTGDIAINEAGMIPRIPSSGITYRLGQRTVSATTSSTAWSCRFAAVALTLAFSSLAAFAFARYKFPLKEVHLLSLLG